MYELGLNSNYNRRLTFAFLLTKFITSKLLRPDILGVIIASRG